MENNKKVVIKEKNIEVVTNEKEIENDETINIVKKKKNKLYLIILIVFSLILIASIFLIGYFFFNWFQKEANNIIQINKEQYQVDYYKEKMKLTFIINQEENNENSNQQYENIDIDFFVIINSKRRLTYFGTKDYLYNASLVILGTNISHQYNYLSTGQFNVTNEEEVNNILLNYNVTENPFAKFSFYENGTLLEIYLPDEISKFTSSLIIDLIEKIIPRISKEYFEKKDINKVTFKLKNNTNSSNDTTLLEIHEKKEFIDKYSNISINGSSSESNIERKVNKDNQLENIYSNAELILNSQKDDNKENFVDIGLNNFHFKIDSNIQLIIQKKQIDTVKLINKISKKVNLIESTLLMKSFDNKENEENEDNEEKNEDINKNDIEEENQINENQSRNLFVSIPNTNPLTSPIILPSNPNTLIIPSCIFTLLLYNTNILGKNIGIQYQHDVNQKKTTSKIKSYSENSYKIFSEMSIYKPINNTYDLFNKKLRLVKIKYCFVICFDFTVDLKGKVKFKFLFNTRTFISSITSNIEIIGTVGAGKFIRVEGGLKGNLLNVALTHSVNIGNNLCNSKVTVSISAGKISTFIKFKLFFIKIAEILIKICDGWSKSFTRSLN